MKACVELMRQRIVIDMLIVTATSSVLFWAVMCFARLVCENTCTYIQVICKDASVRWRLLHKYNLYCCLR